MPDIEIPLPVDAVPQPTESQIAKTGPRRLVKLVPFGPGISGPAIWTSAVMSDEIDGKKTSVRKCVVLVQKSPIQTAAITVPADFYDRLTDIPVEW